MIGKSGQKGFSAAGHSILGQPPRRLSENSRRSEEQSNLVHFFDHLRRIAGLFNENDRENGQILTVPQ